MVLALVQLVDCSNWFLVLLFSSPFSCGKIVYDKNPFLAKDAKWETEGEAFEDLLERPNRCDAPVCLCPEGREYVLTYAYIHPYKEDLIWAFQDTNLNFIRTIRNDFYLSKKGCNEEFSWKCLFYVQLLQCAFYLARYI